MFRKLLPFLLCASALGQATNPQNTYVSSVLVNSPSLYLNYNDATSAFRDQISGSNFSGVASLPTPYGTFPTTTNAYGPGQVFLTGFILPTGSVTSIEIKYAAAPTSGWTLTCGVFTNTSGSNWTAGASVVLTSNGSIDQKFNAPTNFTAFASTSGQMLGCWAPAAYSEPFNGAITGNTGYYLPAAQSSFPVGSFSYTAVAGGGYAVITTVSVPYTSGTVTTQQPGFDNTNNTNYSAEYPYNGFSVAPNNTLGAFDWSSPETLMIHVDRLNWTRSGTLVLASKGDTSQSTNFWRLYLQMSGQDSQLCFESFGIGPGAVSGAPANADNVNCTVAAVDVMPNGFNYNIMVQLGGNGSVYSNSIYINGLAQSLTNSQVGSKGFGYVTVALSGSGTGYASNTYFSNNGTGGSNCNVFGVMNATGGVPALSNPFNTTPAPNGTYPIDYGCTSTPTLTFSFSQTASMSFGGASNVPTLTSSTTATSVNNGVGSGVPAGSLLVVQGLPPSTTAVTDSGGATCSLASGASGGDSLVYTCPNVTSGSHTITATFTSGSTYTSINSVDVIGAATTSPVDTTVYATGTGTAISVGPITTTGTGEFLVGFAGNSNIASNGWTAGGTSPWPGKGGNSYTYSYLSAPTAGAQPTWAVTATTSNPWYATIVAIKPLVTTYSATGTGATVVATMSGASMNSAASPIMAPGYINTNVAYGVAGSASTQTPTYVDEFAEFPSTLSLSALGNIFYQTKFYQGLNDLASVGNPVKVIFDDDGCNDLDNLWALQAAISEQNLGYIRLVGVVETNLNYNDVAIFRQMLDQAGLASVPVGVVGTLASGAGGAACPTGNINIFNSSTLAVVAAEPGNGILSAATVYRLAMAGSPTKPVIIFSAGSTVGIQQFMQSAADSISPLTGQQLWNLDVTNGGAVYMQGGGGSFPSLPNTAGFSGGIGSNWGLNYTASQYILTNQNSMPLYWYGGTPQSSGPDPEYTRIGTDPMWLACSNSAWTSCVRSAWDSLPMANLISSYFAQGVTIGVTGGTGYANSTVFNLSGGGSTCSGSGIMTASSGVPNGFTTASGVNINVEGAYAALGAGKGCTSAPTVTLVAPTGTGATFTTYLTSLCGTDVISGGSDSFTTGTCSNQYIVFQNQYAGGSGISPIFTQFMDSLIDAPPNGSPRIVPQ